MLSFWQTISKAVNSANFKIFSFIQWHSQINRVVCLKDRDAGREHIYGYVYGILDFINWVNHR